MNLRRRIWIMRKMEQSRTWLCFALLAGWRNTTIYTTWGESGRSSSEPSYAKATEFERKDNSTRIVRELDNIQITATLYTEKEFWKGKYPQISMDLNILCAFLCIEYCELKFKELWLYLYKLVFIPGNSGPLEALNGRVNIKWQYFDNFTTK